MVSTAVEYILGAVIGITVGFVGGFAGIGGAPFIVAGLSIIVGYRQHLAQGTTVAVMLGPMSAPGVYVMWDRCKVLKWYILAGVLTYAVFSYLGALVAYQLTSDGMQQLFGLFILLLGIRSTIRGIMAHREYKREQAAKAAAAKDQVEMTDMNASTQQLKNTNVDSSTTREITIQRMGSLMKELEEMDDKPENADRREFLETEIAKLYDEHENGADPTAAVEIVEDNTNGTQNGTKTVDDDDNEEGADDDTDKANGDSRKQKALRALSSSAKVKTIADHGHKGATGGYGTWMNPDGLTYTKEPKVAFSLVVASIMGAVVGTVGGLFGIGAGVLMVPIMTTMFHIQKDDARAMSLGILCPPVSLGAVIEYQRRGDINWYMVLLQFLAYMMFNYWGAKAGKKISGRSFSQILGVVLAALGILTIVLAAEECGGICA